MRFRIVLLILSSLISSDFVFAYKTPEILTEAQSSFLKGDFYNSHRYYDLAFSQEPNAFATLDVENYIVAKYHLIPSYELKTFCNENIQKGKLKDDFIFYCGKIFLYLGDFVTSVEFLEKLPKSLHRLEYHFVKASAYIKLNKSEQCLSEMKAAKEKITPQTSDRFKDVLNVLYARCNLEQGLYNKALANYQSLNVKSDFYLSTLEEQAWAHFKVRNLVASREIMNILINYLTSKVANQSTFGVDVYFRVRYLQGYTELILQNSEKSKQIFASLNSEIKAYRKNFYEKIKVPKSLIEPLKALQNYTDLKTAKYAMIKQYRDFLQQWDDQQNITEFDKNLRLLVAINIEAKRAKSLSRELASYKEDILQLQEKQAKLVLYNIQNYLVNSQRNMDSILFKSNMGQVENIWAERTEGKRTLAEVLDTYKVEVNQVENYLVK